MNSKRIRRPRVGRRHNQKGRSIGGTRFVMLEHWLLKTEAWRGMGPVPRALYVELAQRYNGSNNGEISMSTREAARLIHAAKDTVTKGFRELEEKGFVRKGRCGSFHWKTRHATTWVLTEHPMDDAEPTREFASWRSSNSVAGPKSRRKRPKSGPVLLTDEQVSRIGILILGLSALFCTTARSQIKGHI